MSGPLASQDRPSTVQVWLTAARPRTLWAAVSPVIVGSSIALRDHAFHGPSALAALLGAILIQIGTNLANDLFDHLHGADDNERVGPLRVTQAGWVTRRQITIAMVTVFALAILVGVYLVMRGGWPIVAIGLTSIAAAIFYTGGPKPYGYHGWGDLFTFVFFGPVAVVGSYYVQALSTTSVAWMGGVAMGALVTSILVVNNARDRQTDLRAGKRTMAVRLGPNGSAWEYLLLLMTAAIVPVVLVVGNEAPWTVLASSIAILSARPTVSMLYRAPTPPQFNTALAATARLTLWYALAFGIGINIGM